MKKERKLKKRKKKAIAMFIPLFFFHTISKEKWMHSVAKATNKLFNRQSRKERPIVANFSSRFLRCIVSIRNECYNAILYMRVNI